MINVNTKCVLFIVCETPPSAQAYANPTYISGQFLTGDTIDYECNGDLIPNDPVTLTCTDIGGNYSVWLPDVATTPLPTCSK